MSSRKASGKRKMTTESSTTEEPKTDLSLESTDIPTTQGLSLWCFNIVGGVILTIHKHSHYSGVIPMVFQHSGGRDFDQSQTLPLATTHSGVIPIWCFNIVRGEILTDMGRVRPSGSEARIPYL